MNMSNLCHLKMVEEFQKNRENMTKKEEEKEIDRIVRIMLPNRNHDKVPYEINKEYTWKNFTTVDFDKNDNRFRSPAICKFKVTRTYTDDRGDWCVVEYTVGEYAGETAGIPLDDMPLTIEDR